MDYKQINCKNYTKKLYFVVIGIVYLLKTFKKEDFYMKMRKGLVLLCMLALMVGVLSGCGSDNGGKRIVRIGHNQSTAHPSHVGLEAFADFINEKLGDKYVVEVYPSELLGSQNEMVQLTQTGAIDFCIASNAILETFSKNYISNACLFCIKNLC